MVVSYLCEMIYFLAWVVEGTSFSWPTLYEKLILFGFFGFFTIGNVVLFFGYNKLAKNIETNGN